MPVDTEHHRLVHAIDESIKIAWYHLAPCPSRNANFDGKRVRLVRIDRYLHSSIPRISGLLSHLDLSFPQRNLSNTAGEEIYIQRVLSSCVDIARNGSHEPRDVSRTARHAEPGTALLLSVRLEWVLIEKQLAIERHARNQSVI